MTSRPRRSAATKASEVIAVQTRLADATDRSDRETMSSRRSGRYSGAGAGAAEDPMTVNVATERPSRGSARQQNLRNRGAKKSYVVDSSPDDDEDEEEEAEIEDDEDDEDVDADGDDDMDVDADGEDVDAEGDVDMDQTQTSIAPTIEVSGPGTSRPGRVAKVVMDDEDDESLSDPQDSDQDETMNVGGGDNTMNDDEDAEGEIEVAGDGIMDEDDDDEEDEEDEDAEGDDDEDVDAEGEEIHAGGAALGDEYDSEDGEGTPRLEKMTKRQRARFEDEPQQFMKLSDEVQVKKHFTAEEHAMRRQEMARRRRNLSEKRNEEVKMETINKLLKKQAPKISRKAAAAAANAEGADGEGSRPSPVFVRWVSSKDGSRVSVPEEMLAGPAGDVFRRGGMEGKMVQEVA